MWLKYASLYNEVFSQIRHFWSKIFNENYETNPKIFPIAFLTKIFKSSKSFVSKLPLRVKLHFFKFAYLNDRGQNFPTMKKLFLNLSQLIYHLSNKNSFLISNEGSEYKHCISTFLKKKSKPDLGEIFLIPRYLLRPSRLLS